MRTKERLAKNTSKIRNAWFDEDSNDDEENMVLRPGKSLTV